MTCVHELTLALADVAAHAQFDDMREYQAMLGTQYAVSMGLLRSHEENPRDLRWLVHTRASAGCLGLWSEPTDTATAVGGVGAISDRKLDITGSFAREQVQPVAGAPSLTTGAFPPTELLTHAGEAPGSVIFVVPVRIPSSDWGLLAVVAGTETRVPAGQEILSQSAALLAVALEHEAVVMALRAQEEQLRRCAVYDGLTGLPNRTLFMERLSLATARTKRPGADDFAVLFLDLDGFKAVNDSLGHDAGDQLLVQVAERLTAQLREVDVAARFGGDEFLVLIEGAPDVEFATKVAERLQAALAKPYLLAGHQVIISASVGIAMSGPRCKGAEHLLRDADIAMYSAKSRKKGTHAAFDIAMHGRS
jgi:diguanylate cyclase (GGDEF)-like protein